MRVLRFPAAIAAAGAIAALCVASGCARHGADHVLSWAIVPASYSYGYNVGAELHSINGSVLDLRHDDSGAVTADWLPVALQLRGTVRCDGRDSLAIPGRPGTAHFSQAQAQALQRVMTSSSTCVVYVGTAGNSGFANWADGRISEVVTRETGGLPR
jgi:hypothetical protein